jgi:chemotaxis protein MotB
LSTSPSAVIIKRVKKVSGGGHHGGAWKVAYADFVTAMMAFFLLMWLLNATTEEQRKGIAEYFDPSIPIAQDSAGGRDALNGSSVFSADTLAKNGSGGVKKREDAEDVVESQPKSANAKKLQALQQDLLRRAIAEGAGSLAQHLQTKITPDGLVIELVEVDGSPLFEVGSSRPSPIMEVLLSVVADVVSQVSNRIAIVGHTDSLPYSGGRDYSNWELSTDRANMARRLLVARGLLSSQVSTVSGKADTEPLAADPQAPQNRRISITLLRDDPV